MTTTQLTCTKCRKTGRLAGDETDPGANELALDSRGLVAANEYVCGECLSAAEDRPQLTDAARRNLALNHDPDAVQAAWDRGDFGTIYDSQTDEAIRPATADEAIRSFEAGPDGHIEIDGRTVYVQP